MTKCVLVGAPERYDSRTQYRIVTKCKQITDLDIVSLQKAKLQKASDHRLKKDREKLIEAVLDCEILATSSKEKEKLI